MSYEALKSGSKLHLGTSLVVQQLRLHAPSAEGLGLIPGQGTSQTSQSYVNQP